MTQKNRFLVAATVCGLLFPIAPAYAENSGDSSNTVAQIGCVVTAYYQPVAEQTNFEKGSFSADVSLNGDDTTADGSKVKLGTVAAPPDYPFGTVIDIQGFGVGEVHDRGGAIKGNRFDIWVGKGDEGLARALNWGKKTTTCTVYLPGTPVPSSVKSRIGTYNLPSASLPPTYWEKKLSGGHKNLAMGQTGEDVTLLRKSLNQAGFTVKASGDFDTSLEKQVIAFQIKQNIITSEDDAAAGIVGPRTWQALLSQKNADVKDVVTTQVTTATGAVVTTELAYGAEGIEVSKLQENLRQLGYFDSPTITGYFGPATKSAIVRFQLAEKLITSADDVGAGDFSLNTKDRLLAVLLGKKTVAPAPVLALQKGNKGAEVQILQEKLQKLGVYTGPVTDFYGEQTQQAVSAFQTKYNVQLKDPENKGTFDNTTATRLDQALGMDISLSPAYIRYFEPFTLVQGQLKSGS